jgi:hypothetical protein
MEDIMRINSDWFRQLNEGFFKDEAALLFSQRIRRHEYNLNSK